jgi:hypothetical protein
MGTNAQGGCFLAYINRASAGVVLETTDLFDYYERF